jgi:hypothetical protein
MNIERKGKVQELAEKLPNKMAYKFYISITGRYVYLRTLLRIQRNKDVINIWVQLMTVSKELSKYVRLSGSRAGQMGQSWHQTSRLIEEWCLLGCYAVWLL